MELDIQGASLEPPRFIGFGREESAQPVDLPARDAVSGQRRRRRLDRGAVLEQRPQLLGPTAHPLQRQLAHRVADKCSAELASPYLHVALVLEPAQALPDGHAVYPEPKAELTLGGEALPGKVFVEPDGGKQQLGYLVPEPVALRALG